MNVVIPSGEDFKRLEDKIDQLNIKLDLYGLKTGAPNVVNVKFIAKVEGLSYSQITRTESYLLPNFGVSDYPDGTARWDLEHYLQWRKIPREERKKRRDRWLLEQSRKEVEETRK